MKTKIIKNIDCLRCCISDTSDNDFYISINLLKNIANTLKIDIENLENCLILNKLYTDFVNNKKETFLNLGRNRKIKVYFKVLNFENIKIFETI
jgi:hypothetical protein